MITDLATYDPERTYTTAAHDYAAAVEQFWGFCADNTVSSLDLRAGDRVLDVACGPGVATIREAELVGPSGWVEGVDISSEMLHIARKQASDRQLSNIAFRRADMDDLPHQPDSYDAVTMVLGLFFAKDIEKTLSGLWRLVKPGGTLAVTTLGAKFFHPMFDVFLDAVRVERPDLDPVIPWRRTEDPRRLSEALKSAGVESATITDTVTEMELSGPDAWWQIVRGTGIRRIEMELTESESDRVRESNARWLVNHRIDRLELGVNYAKAVKR